MGYGVTSGSPIFSAGVIFRILVLLELCQNSSLQKSLHTKVDLYHGLEIHTWVGCVMGWGSIPWWSVPCAGVQYLCGHAMGWRFIPGLVVSWVGVQYLGGLCHGLWFNTWVDCAMGWGSIPGWIVP